MASKIGSLTIALDVGHRSIGWSVVQDDVDPEVLGTGVVTFGADDCLASKRRDFRRQRRHIRSTRRRIDRIERLLIYLGVITENEIRDKHCQAGGHSSPWLLAARILCTTGQAQKKHLLTWTQLWDVIRWYAHNRGYNGNALWASDDSNEDGEDTEKVQNARQMLEEHGKSTMAETICAYMKLDPLGNKEASRIRYKAMNAAFPRSVVEEEFRRILQAHFGHLPAVDEKLEQVLCDDWAALPVPGRRLAKHYMGGLLFGQLKARFENRIVGKCPKSGKNLPSKKHFDFLLFRWGEFIANIRVGHSVVEELRPLSAQERTQIHAAMEQQGFLTAGQLKAAVRQLPGVVRDDLENHLLHPRADESLVIDPARKALSSDKRLAGVWNLLGEAGQKRTLGRLRKGKSTSLRDLREQVEKRGGDLTAFDQKVNELFAEASARKRKVPLTKEIFIREKISAKIPMGRAPYGSDLMKEAWEEVLEGLDPKSKKNAWQERDGCLVFTEDEIMKGRGIDIDKKTNNHLIRHRLLILNRLLEDILAEFAPPRSGAHISRVVVEVNRDLQAMSGKDSVAIKGELNQMLAEHQDVANYLQAKGKYEEIVDSPLPRGTPLTAGLIRKGRIAADLGWRCPYTGKEFEPSDLAHGTVDLDHVVPRSQRMSDAMDSLVVTFKKVNQMKGKRTALQFVQQEGGKAVDGMRQTHIFTSSQYKAFVDGLKTKTTGSHKQDEQRRKRRKGLMLLEKYEEKAFLPSDLTVTSHLVRMAAQLIEHRFSGATPPPVVMSMPGSVTGLLRKSWNLLGCLEAANPLVMHEVTEKEENKTTKKWVAKPKGEIRSITDLHHALDACVLGIASQCFPSKQGRLWKAMVKESNLDRQDLELLKATGHFDISKDGARLKELPVQLKKNVRDKLAEKRVVQHIPKTLRGLKVETMTWRVKSIKDGVAYLEQRVRDAKGERPKAKENKVPTSRILMQGKLAALKGALQLNENFGAVLLEPDDNQGKPRATEDRIRILRWFKVHQQIKELIKENGGKRPRILRNGQIIFIPKATGRSDYRGYWQITSIKDNNSGPALDIVRLEHVKPVNRVEWAGMNISLVTLLNAGMQIHDDLGSTGRLLYTGLAQQKPS